MADVYLDHNVARTVGLLLALDGHDVASSHDINGERLPDDALLLTAVRLKRIFVTHNRKDFKLLHDAWLSWPAAFGLALPPHPGILVLDTAAPEVLARVVATFLNDGAHERLPNRMLWWHRHDGWRQPTAGPTWGPYRPRSEDEQES